MKKALAICMTVVFMACALVGCQKEKDDTYSPASSGIYVREDGTIVSADIEDFGEAYYDVKELKEFVETEVIAYNKAKAGISEAYKPEVETDKKDESTAAPVIPVTIYSLEAKGGKASLLLEFATAKDYLAFNGEVNSILTALSQKTVGEAEAAGASFSGLKTEEGEEAKAEKVQKKDKYFYLTLSVSEDWEGSFPVQVQGTVKFVSSNVTITAENTVTVPAGEKAVIIYQ